MEIATRFLWWACLDLNQGPIGYAYYYHFRDPFRVYNLDYTLLRSTSNLKIEMAYLSQELTVKVCTCRLLELRRLVSTPSPQWRGLARDCHHHICDFRFPRI